MVLYDAATGQRLFKTQLGASEPALYRCSNSRLTIDAVTTSNPKQVTLGAGSIGCAPFPPCPLGTTAGMDGSYLTCTTEQSNFVMGIEDWVDEHLFGVPMVQLRAWGGGGDAGDFGTAAGGLGGFALTVRRPSELPQALYAYTGNKEGSTLVSAGPLLSLPIDFSQIPPDPGPIVLVAGGGGHGGDDSSGCGTAPTAGGDGGVSIANASPSGGPVSTAGADAHDVERGQSGGQGGNTDGLGSGGSGGSDGGGNGGRGIGDGNWNTAGSLIVPSGWAYGRGGSRELKGGVGGGGFGGGGGGSDASCGSGGGGGGSWASGNTVRDPGAPTAIPALPASVGAFAIAYLPQASEICTLISKPSPAVRCTLTTSEVAFDLATLDRRSESSRTPRPVVR